MSKALYPRINRLEYCSLKAIEMKVFLVLSFFCLIQSYSAAQAVDGSSGLAKETVLFNTPKTLYLVGEKIWFEAEVTSGQKPSPSKVLYAELVDRYSNSVAYTKVPLAEGKTLNYLLLSPAIPSDHYLLRVYTRISPYLDLNVGIAQQFVTVINPKIPLKPVETPLVTSLSKANDTGNMGQISRTRPKAGESFEISFEASDRVLAAGISIFNPYLNEEQRQLQSDAIYASITEKALLPELFGHIVAGQVPSPDTTMTYFLSLHGKQSALFTDRADNNGLILFDAGGLSHWDRLIIQLEDGAEMEGLQLVSPVIDTKFLPGFDFPTLTIDQTNLDFLDQLQKASAVETYYIENYDQDSLEVVTGFVADHTFMLDDFTRFETVETVIREYVPSVFVRTRDKEKVFRLVDEAVKNVFDTNPLILIDAMPVFDSDLLSGFNPKFLSKLEVLNREFYLNDRTYPGVMSFSSYENNFGLFPLAPAARFFDYFGLQPKIEFNKSQFNSPDSSETFPDYRTILFWGKAEATSIQSSRLMGDFLFWVRYLDATGKIQVSKKKITVIP